MFDFPARTIEAPLDYAAIFDERGAAYHRAMLECPHARDREFAEVVALADARPGMVVCDAPSGGGYLRPHVPATTFIALETCETFHRYALARGDCSAVLSPLDRIELPDRSVDRVISLAGLHHLADRPAFFREAHRILKPEGALCVADVGTDTDVARFLNVFVDRHNSMGHDGRFLDDAAVREVKAAGLAVEVCEPRRYAWTFPSEAAMTRFTTLMFGLDRATPGEVRGGIERYLGTRFADGAWRMGWGLTFVRAIRPARP